MKKIVIIGAGFAGLAAFFKLRNYKKRESLEISIVNDKPEFSFLPMLPDCIGRSIGPGHLICDLAALSSKYGFDFIKDKAISVDLVNKKVSTSALTLSYDYLVIASGSETNFYGNDLIRKHAFKLDDAADAVFMREALERRVFDNYLVAGGGYTGVETATNLKIYLDKKGIDKRIVIVERAASILGPLPQWMKDYVLTNLKRLKIEILTNVSIERIDDRGIQTSDAKTFENPMLIWAAGVRAADFIQNLGVEKNAQGRIKVDEYLRINDSCFSAGDTAYFSYKNNFLRMAVQFAIMQGNCAAGNIIKSIKGEKPVKYKPVDFGYVIPMANNKSCGVILGINIKGFLPTLLHYFMCIYRSYGFKNKLGIIKDLMGG